MGIDCAKNIVENVDVSISIKGSSKRDSGLLSSRESGASLTDDFEVAVAEEVQIRFQRSVLDGFGVSFGIVLLAEEDVVPDGIVHDPSNLTGICDGAVGFDSGFSFSPHLAENTVSK
jgi:hypothetical protein